MQIGSRRLRLKFVPSRGGMEQNLACIAALVLTTATCFGQVGKRTQMVGKKSTPAEIKSEATASIHVGSLRLTPRSSEAWKSTPIEDVGKAFPDKKSLYVLGNFSGATDQLDSEIRKLGDAAQILERSSNSVIIYTNKDSAKKLASTREQKTVDIIEPLTPKQKLTPELRRHLNRLKNAGRNDGEDRATRLPQNSRLPSKIGPRGENAALSPVPRADAPPVASGTKVNVTFYLFKGQRIEDVQKKVEAAGGKVVDKGSDQTITAIRATVPASQIEAVASLPSVREATIAPTYVKQNDKALQVLLDGSMSSWTLPLHGAGQIVGHADSGLDNGQNDASLSASFRGRVKKAFARGRNDAHDWSDFGGHGTHTAGSILGTGSHPGIAPECQLVHQSLDDEAGALRTPTPLGTLFEEAYGEGARIHSNSWGVPAITESGNDFGGRYLPGSEELDSWSWNNGSPRDMLIVFSAGNNGDYEDDGMGGTMTVTSPGTAKNCLTVGACENNRPENGTDADDPTDLASFSSKGPTRRNRTKPDVVAPGTWIASAKTHGAKFRWADNINNSTVTSSSPTGWIPTPGFKIVTDPPGGAFFDNRAWQLKMASGVGVNERLLTPEVGLPAGPSHPLSIEFRLRGDARELDDLQVGVLIGSDERPLYAIPISQYSDWVLFNFPLPEKGDHAEFAGKTVRFFVNAHKQANLAHKLELFVDQFDLTTFDSWASLSSMRLNKATDDDDSNFTFNGGTSMAAPLCAGCAVLVRQSLVDAGATDPSAELIKAMLINTADAHQGARPNVYSGWGRVNLRRAIEQDFIFDFKSKLKQGESKNYDVVVAAGTKQLRITLVWADKAGELLVNDLDLKLTSPNNVESLAEDVDGISPDRTNNVEGIDKSSPEAGTWKVTISAPKVIPNYAQPYAIVVSQLK